MNATGYVPWGYGASATYRPPAYVVRWRGRWWRSPPMAEMGARGVALVRALGPLDRGSARVRGYVGKAGVKLSDLPVLDPEELGR